MVLAVHSDLSESKPHAGWGRGQRRRNRHNEWQGDKANNRPPVLGPRPPPSLHPRMWAVAPLLGDQPYPQSSGLHVSRLGRPGRHQGPRPTTQSPAVLARLHLQESPGPPSLSRKGGPFLSQPHRGRKGGAAVLLRELRTGPSKSPGKEATVPILQPCTEAAWLQRNGEGGVTRGYSHVHNPGLRYMVSKHTRCY